jgi:hypothetical protein
MKLRVLVLALVMAAALQPASASTFVAMSTTEMVRSSSAVVEGEVLAVSSYWSDSGRIILTEVMLQVRDVYAGEAASVVRVKTFGGTVDGYTVVAHGFPTFEKGQRLVLFLEPDDVVDMFRVVGYQQGLYRVERQRDGQEKAMSSVDHNARLISADGREVSYSQILPLATLKQQVADVAARLSARPQQH